MGAVAFVYLPLCVLGVTWIEVESMEGKERKKSYGYDPGKGNRTEE